MITLLHRALGVNPHGLVWFVGLFVADFVRGSGVYMRDLEAFSEP